METIPFPDNLSISVTEVHGVISGMLAMGQVLDGLDWLTPAFGDEVCGELLRADAGQSINQMSQDILLSLQETGLVGDIPIPPDELAFSNRARALESWVNGVLSGLGLGGLDKSQLNEGETKEIITDLEKISRQLSPLSEWAHETEDDENDLAEIIEYVRIAPGIIYQQLSHLPS